MLREEVLAADAPVLGNICGDAAPELLHPVPARVTPSVDAARVNVVAIQGRVLAIHLLGDDDPFALERRQRVDHTVVVVDPFRPWQMMSARKIGSTNVCTQVNNAKLVCRILLEKKKYIT